MIVKAADYFIKAILKSTISTVNLKNCGNGRPIYFLSWIKTNAAKMSQGVRFGMQHEEKTSESVIILQYAYSCT